jgi:DNA-binding NtrC family response regulator
MGWETLLSTTKVLLLSEDQNEVYYLRESLGGYAMVMHARSLAEMASRLERTQYDVVLCGWPFYQDGWHGELKNVRERYPDLPVVVLSRADTKQKGMDVMDAAAFDLPTVPSPKPVLLPVVEHARVSHDARKMQRAAAAEPAALFAS